MTESEQIDTILEAMFREGIILKLPEDQFKMTEFGMLKASEIIAQDYKLQRIEAGGIFDEKTEKPVLEEFANSIANSPVGVLGYLVRYYKGLNA